MTYEMVRAEGAWLLFDRAFRLGIDREMMTVLNAFPALTKFLAVLGGTPATLGAILAFTFLSSAIEKITKSIEQAEHAQQLFDRAMSSANLTAEQQTQALVVQNDQIQNQIAKLEHRPANLLALAIDQDIEKMLKLASTSESALAKIDEDLDNSKMHVTWWGAAAVNAWEFVKAQVAAASLHAPTPEYTTSDKAQVNIVKEHVDAIRELNKEYAVAIASAGDDPAKKQAVSTEHAIKLNEQYTKSIHEIGRAYDELKGKSGEEGNKRGIDTLIQGQRELILQQAQLKQQEKTDSSQGVLDKLQQQNEAMQKQLAIEQARLESAKQVNDAQIKLNEDEAKRRLALGEITEQQYTALMSAEITKRYQQQEEVPVAFRVEFQTGPCGKGSASYRRRRPRPPSLHHCVLREQMPSR